MTRENFQLTGAEDVLLVCATLAATLAADQVLRRLGVSEGQRCPALHMDPLLRVEDVASLLQVSERTVWQLVADGLLVPIRLRKRISRFPAAQIEAYVRACSRRGS